MTKSIIVDNVSKKFRLYHDKSLTLKERILFASRTNYSEFKVLDKVSLSIEKGKTVGLIGQNGSGKSTLLKLLTGIIYPDEGSINIQGKVSSLLELGAGFHPDFSGRENIYNNASIFGLTRKEIDKRYNSIVAFSELEKYIDNPIRTYSSGMYMRLAFSVAINVDADVLLIDEILAVGDASFQKKCLDKINDLKKQGTTIILVTHDMGAIERICDTAVWIDNGRIVEQGHIFNVVNSYLQYMGEKKTSSSDSSINNQVEIKANNNQENKRWGNKDITFEQIQLLDNEGNSKDTFKCGDTLCITLKYQRHNRNLKNSVFGVGFFRNDGLHCYGTHTLIDRYMGINLTDSGIIKFFIKELTLLEGRYWLDVAVASEDGFPYDYIKEATCFNIFSETKDIGVARMPHYWEHKEG